MRENNSKCKIIIEKQLGIEWLNENEFNCWH